MKLYRGQHTCAIGMHVLLEEIGAPYETEQLDVAGGANRKPPFIDINPKGKVPTLVRDDGSVLTEYGAIATWLARKHPEKDLLPADTELQARALEIMDYAIGTLHAQGFTRIFKPELFDMFGSEADAVKARGRELVEQAFFILDRLMADRAYVAGSQFTIADTALFYAERWAPQIDMDLPPWLAAHLSRMKDRPAVQRVMKIWGES